MEQIETMFGFTCILLMFQKSEWSAVVVQQPVQRIFLFQNSPNRDSATRNCFDSRKCLENQCFHVKISNNGQTKLPKGHRITEEQRVQVSSLRERENRPILTRVTPFFQYERKSLEIPIDRKFLIGSAKPFQLQAIPVQCCANSPAVLRG